MTEDDIRTYIAAVNANDFDGFSSYYADDVDFRLGERKHIMGRQAIVDFYREVKAHIDEKLEILDLIVAPDGAALHSRFELRCRVLRVREPAGQHLPGIFETKVGGDTRGVGRHQLAAGAHHRPKYGAR